MAATEITAESFSDAVMERKREEVLDESIVTAQVKGENRGVNKTTLNDEMQAKERDCSGNVELKQKRWLVRKGRSSSEDGGPRKW